VDVQEGPGWRLVIDPARDPFSVLVGGPGWACELSSAEAAGLAHACRTLTAQHRALRDQLMAEEEIGLEHEAPLHGEGLLWMGLEGDRTGWALTFVLDPGVGRRAVEGTWPVGSAAAFAAALVSRPEILG
jgi:hypothetical protein